MEQTEVKQGWSWLGFFFAPYYYAGYGNLQKGLILAVVSGLIPLFAIFVGVYGGLKVKKELPIGNVDFNWKNVGITLVVLLVISFISMTVIQSMQG